MRWWRWTWGRSDPLPPTQTLETFLHSFYRQGKMILPDGEEGLFLLEQEAYRIRASIIPPNPWVHWNLPVCPHSDIEGTVYPTRRSLQGCEFHLL